MSLRRLVSNCVVAATLLSSPAKAQVVANGPVNGLGTFVDQGTGRTWLRLDNFFGQSPTQMVSIATEAGFTVAAQTDVQQLLVSLPLNDGQWNSYLPIIGDSPTRQLYWGLYSTGTTTEQASFYAFSNETAWSTTAVGLSWDALGSSLDDQALWAYRTSTVPEPATTGLMALGLGMIALYARKRRA